jgi:hypothetical protein
MKAKLLKILGWTLGMAAGIYLIMDGKSRSQHSQEHLLIGAGIGLALGLIFARNIKAVR